ncbi:MAG: SDR family oxidoreductase [Gemmatimonadota bacterium]|nr:SDR family oxidoreductase [Gemmatimonadota bacterium]
MSALAGKVALVTGASRGIGAAVADALEAAGALAVRISRTAAGDTPLAAIRRSGGADRRIELRCDVSLEHEVHRVAETMLGTVGAPDLLVHSAGAFLLKPLESTSAEEFRRQLDVNLTGAFLVLRAFVPAMAKRGGHVITIGSIADHVAFPGNAAYGASKHGLRGLHEVLRAEYEGSGLRFTLLSPGATDTSLWDPIDPDRRDDLPDRAGMLQASDVAEAVLFAATRSRRAHVELLRLMPR